MIEVAIIAGLAGLWCWSVLNDDDGIVSWVPRLMDRNEYTEKWLRCPWCSGAWLAGGFSLILNHDNFPADLIIAVAAAAITGFLGSYIQGD